MNNFITQEELDMLKQLFELDSEILTQTDKNELYRLEGELDWVWLYFFDSEGNLRDEKDRKCKRRDC